MPKEITITEVRRPNPHTHGHTFGRIYEDCEDCQKISSSSSSSSRTLLSEEEQQRRRRRIEQATRQPSLQQRQQIGIASNAEEETAKLYVGRGFGIAESESEESEGGDDGFLRQKSMRFRESGWGGGGFICRGGKVTW